MRMKLPLLHTLLRIINPPPFRVGDIVRFEPDDRALGWTHDLQGLYPGYIGSVTSIVQGPGFEWDIYLDRKDVGYLSVYFRLVTRA